MKKDKKSAKAKKEVIEDKVQDAKTENSEEVLDRDWEKELAESNDKYLRLYSEFDNYRRRTSRERLELIGSAGQELMTALLPVIDDFERAISAMDDAKDLKSVKDGVGLVQGKLMSILEQKGLRSFQSKGKVFDPDFHEAITKIPGDRKMSGKVVDVIETGYALNDKMLRYAKVVVGE